MVKPLLKERRLCLRTQRILSIEYRLKRGQLKNADRSWHLSTTHEICLGGVSFYSDYEYHTGDVLEIHVAMSGMINVFRGFGKIVHVQHKQMAASYLVAVQFTADESQPQTRGMRQSRIPRVVESLTGEGAK